MSKYGKIYYGSTLVGDVNMAPIVGNFGGLSFSPGPMYLTSDGEYGLCNSFSEHCSYGANTPGNYGPGYIDGYRTYFGIREIGDHFDSAGIMWTMSLTSTGDHTINNQGNLVYGPDNSGAYYGDWRLPTQDDILKIFWPVDYNQQTPALTRPGSTVNGTNSVVCAIIRVQHSTILPVNNITGLLAFPDGENIVGANILNNNNFYCSLAHPVSYSQGYPIKDMMTSPQGILCPLITAAELNEFIKQGCVFLPMMGRTVLEGATSIKTWMCFDAENPALGNITDFIYTANLNGSLNTNLIGAVLGMDNMYCWLGTTNIWPQTGGIPDLLNADVPVYLVRTYGSGEGE